ncbi:MAG: hypothetical protein ACFFCW_48300 [Candidatus Hodarchaeota archaeon]
MKRLSILSLIIIVSLSAYAINEEKETAKESGSASFQPKPLADEWSKWLVGQWEGSFESDVGTGKIRTKIEFGLNGQFLIMKSEAEITEITDKQRQYLKETLYASDEYIEKFQNWIFEELQIHTIDPKTGERIAYFYDSQRCIATGKGKLKGNKEIMEWVWSVIAQGTTSLSIIEKINDNKIVLNHKYTLPDGNKMEAKTEMTRKKETVKDSSSHSFSLKPLDDEWSKWLVGKWKAVSGQSDFLGDESEDVGESSEEGAAGFTIELALNGQFLIWKPWAETGEITEITDEQREYLKDALRGVSDEDIERFLSMPYKSMQIQTIDPTTGERIAYVFDSLRCIAKGTGRLEGNKEIMEWEWSVTSQGVTSVSIMEKINDNTFTASMKYTLPNGKKMEEKLEMTRKKTITEGH